MTFKDMIKSSVYENLGGGTSLSAGAVIMVLVIAALIGVYIFCVYKLSAKTAFYSRDLNITLAGMPIIVSAIMVAMQSNLIVSLGMVGALSIVRFRNAVKNPLDLLYLFWSLSAGIICGVGLKVLAAVLCVVMTALLLLLQLVPNSKASSLLVIRSRSDEVDWAAVKKLICSYSKNVKEKSRSFQSGETEVIYELTAVGKEELLKELQKDEKFSQINFLSFDGEYRI